MQKHTGLQPGTFLITGPRWGGAQPGARFYVQVAGSRWRAVTRSRSGSVDTSTVRSQGLIGTWPFLQLPNGKYGLSKPCQCSWMGQRKGALMINSVKSSGFCIPMVPGLSGCHVTRSGHFLADWGKLVSKHRWFLVSSAVRDNRGQQQLCLAKLAALVCFQFCFLVLLLSKSPVTLCSFLII